MSIPEGDVGPMLDAISSKFSARHRQISKIIPNELSRAFITDIQRSRP
jgi:hypothetical protein